MVHDVQVRVLAVDGCPGHDERTQREAGGADCGDKADLPQLLAPAAALDGEPTAQGQTPSAEISTFIASYPEMQ